MGRKRQARGVAAVSVDLDEVSCYAAIHGLASSDAPGVQDALQASRHAIYQRALPRLVRLFEDEGLRATFFVIGRDVASEGNGARLRGLVEAGHELGNHTFHHLYDFSRGSPAEIEADIADAHAAITEATGFAPHGFRAPGYTLSDLVVEKLVKLGYRYDSSVFPCPAYYSAKALAMGAMRARGRVSRSVLDDPRVLLASADPYRVARPYRRRGQGLLELPIGVTRAATGRLPYIGTSVVLGGATGARALSRAMAGRPLINLELHGMDLADAEADGLEWLAPYQPDLRVPLAKKEAALRAAIREVRGLGYPWVRLDDAADELAARR